jgi:two-component system sensor histidine kinase/response regulator
MEGDAGAQHGDRLLVVDDQSGVRDVLAMKLEREGYAVAVAASAHQAGESIANGGLDLILLDIRLPDGSGFDLLARLRETHSALDLPVIVISGLDQADDVVRALKAGANDYVTKPFDLAVVLARVRAQLALRRLKQANDRFLRVASHDLRKPLMLMLDVARRLRADYPAGRSVDEDAHTALGLLIESGEYMQGIIGDLLELRAVRDGRLRLARLPTDLGAIVRQAVARNTPYAQRKGIVLHMQFERDLPHIRADDFRLMQALENLIGNAIKFGPRGARVTVSTRRDGRWLLCEVSDTGPGIPEGEMDRLFTEYAQLSNRPTGGEPSTGLGLAITRELVLLHGGEIGARNNPDGGATFWFRLPLVCETTDKHR